MECREKSLAHPDFPGWELEGFKENAPTGSRTAKIFYNGVVVGNHNDRYLVENYTNQFHAVNFDAEITELIAKFYRAAIELKNLEESRKRELEILEYIEKKRAEQNLARLALGLSSAKSETGPSVSEFADKLEKYKQSVKIGV